MPLKFVNNADGSLDIEIYDVIGLWGLTVADFAARLKALKGKDVNLRINSPGGSITEGLAIMSVIARHDGMVTAHIDGVAASMAGVVAMAAKKIVMPENSFIMIHDPSVGMQGTSEELRKVADTLDKMGEMLITAYTRGGKVDRKKIEVMITGESSSNEHWLTAAECLELGICDEVTSVEVEAAAFAAMADFYPARNFAAVGVIGNSGHPGTEGVAGSNLPPVIPTGGLAKQPNTQMNKLIALLGLAASAAEDTIVAAVQATKDRVAQLEREAKEIATAHAKALTDATNAALQQATKTENDRKTALKAFAAKYNKDGDLNDALVTALSGETTVEAFKDVVLDIVNKRVTTAAIKPKSDASANEGDEVAQFLKSYKDAKNGADRRALVRANRALARKALQTGGSEE